MWEIILGKRTREIIGALLGDKEDDVFKGSKTREELSSVCKTED